MKYLCVLEVESVTTVFEHEVDGVCLRIFDLVSQLESSSVANGICLSLIIDKRSLCHWVGLWIIVFGLMVFSSDQFVVLDQIN